MSSWPGRGWPVCLLLAMSCGRTSPDPQTASLPSTNPTPSSTTSTSTSTTTGLTTPLATTTRTLLPDEAVLLNPERGFYQYIDLVTTTDLSSIRDEGSTLVFSYIRLDDYRDTDLPQSLLDAMTTGFGAARAAGVKVIPRFSYNFGPWPDSDPDASESWVLRHIEQVTPVLQANSDVLAVVQAGFIGAWGEWHSSTEGLLDDPNTKFVILEALLDGLPEDRKVQIRYPYYKDEGYGGPLDASEAHSGTVASRVGHHNDCFLASDTDMGTYPPGERETWLDWLNLENQYVPMGGETCALYPALTDCTPALADFERLRFTYINADYHPDVLSGWETGGCYEEIDRLLGYRLVASTVTYAPTVPVGVDLPVSVTLTNQGWAAPINPRSVELLLVGDTTHTVTLDVDVRWWLPGTDHVIEAVISVPETLQPGTYTLGLALPDAALGLQDDSRYAIRLANLDTWRDGWNALAEVEVTPADAAAAAR